MSLIEALDATWAQFNPRGGQSEIVANTGYLQSALNFTRKITLPGGQAVIGQINTTRSPWIKGAGMDDTILKRGDGLNVSLFRLFGTPSAFYQRPVFEDLTIDMNPANNEGSGAHNALRLEYPLRPIFRRVRVIGALGLFNGAYTGSAVSIMGGAGAIFDDCEFEGGYDAYNLVGHTDALDRGSWLTNNRRAGAVVSSGSHRYVNDGVRAIGNAKVLDGGGGGILILSSNECRGKNPVCRDNLFGIGYQHNGALDCGVEGIQAHASGRAGCDWFMSTGWMDGGFLSGNHRAVEIDSNSRVSASKVRAMTSLDVDWSVFRSVAELSQCSGSVRGWSNDPTGEAYSTIRIHGFHDGPVTLMPGETKFNRFAAPAQTLALENSWTGEVTCRRDEEGSVAVEGEIAGGSIAANTLLFTLPVGFRPSVTRKFSLLTCGAMGAVYVLPDGRCFTMEGAPLSADWTAINIAFRAVT